MLNLQIAKAYPAGTDSAITKRTWQDAIDALIEKKHGANQKRWRNAAKDHAFKILLPQIIIETQGETLLKVLQWALSPRMYFFAAFITSVSI